MAIVEPQKELRFTRAAQAVPFWIAAAICAAATLVLTVISFYRGQNPELPHPLWIALPLVLCSLSVRTALHCTKHAYLILSPLGIEVFPFFRPSSGMQMIPWAQIIAAEIGNHILTLHYSEDQSSGIHLSLAPIPKSRRPLLAKAILGRTNPPT